MFRTAGFIVSSAALSLLSCAGTFAQDIKIQLPNDVYWCAPAGLLGYKQVRDELKLTDDQAEKIQEAALKHRKDISDKLNNPDFPLKDRARLLNEDWARRRAFPAKEFLSTEQSVRFRQMQLWVLGHKAFCESDVADSLDLTEPQRNTLKTIDSDSSNAIYRLTLNNPSFGTGARGKAPEQQEKELKQLIELIAAKEKECRAALTDEQNAKFDKLRGTRFEANVRAVLGAQVLTISP